MNSKAGLGLMLYIIGSAIIVKCIGSVYWAITYLVCMWIGFLVFVYGKEKNNGD